MYTPGGHMPLVNVCLSLLVWFWTTGRMSDAGRLEIVRERVTDSTSEDRSMMFGYGCFSFGPGEAGMHCMDACEVIGPTQGEDTVE